MGSAWFWLFFGYASMEVNLVGILFCFSHNVFSFFFEISIEVFFFYVDSAQYFFCFPVFHFFVQEREIGGEKEKRCFFFFTRLKTTKNVSNLFSFFVLTKTAKDLTSFETSVVEAVNSLKTALYFSVCR
jgi:hypothetical protein